MAEVDSIPDAVPSAVVPKEEEVPANLEAEVELTEFDPEEPLFTLSRGITVRVFRHSDAEELSRLADNKKIGQNMRDTWPDPYTVDAAHSWIANCRDPNKWVSSLVGCPDREEQERLSKIPGKEQKFPQAWVIAIDDKLVGAIGIDSATGFFGRSVGFGYWLGEEYWRRGIASEVVNAFVPWLWKTFPYIVRINAGIYGWNPNSGKVLLKAGLEYEATLRANVSRHGKVTDLIVYSQIRNGLEVAKTMPY